THSTDADGRYEITFSPKQLAEQHLWVELDVSHPAHVSKTQRGFSVSEIRRNEQRGDRPFFELIELARGKAVTGTVVSSTGEPLPKTEIYYVSFSPSDPHFLLLDFAETDAKGRFLIQLVTPGEGALWVKSDDYAPLGI